jgi:hypothetical protein
VLLIDAIVLKIRDGQVTNRPVEQNTLETHCVALSVSHAQSRR